ncbi:MAG: NAD(P)-dependent oxidoreductase [Bacteroidales bacterium]|nr:NAD(P)-dependent oxidoreductase [Bacteroidales bacterium]HOL98132.1 NAD(P)-dependent oxidoreductase [Bacteroidales bacterium]HOM36241.1 NAD(P)-dependent oxidoreductase [Bacteroidales bacterium]HPD23772.1 NAD(P)-dependent oxidoreductase [Bacteroidales bacterium]HRS99750.1 NAD(P)-dependent oxidoreductase [Bacteroidales bacterium]
MNKKILLIDTVHKVLIEKLSDFGFEFHEGYNLSRNQILSIIENYEGIIIRSRITIDKEIIDAAKSLKFIGRVGAGMESIDTEYCQKKNIICLNSPEGNRDAVGEHCLGMLLSLINNINKADSEVKNGIWKREENRGRELGNMCVGIIGYGNMGSSFAKKISGLGCKVISYDKYKKNYSDNFTTEVVLNEIFQQADVVSLHVPLTNETKYLVNENFINSFKKNIYLINSARGPVVNTRDLCNALKKGKILGVALDVLEYEESSFESTKNLLEIDDFRFLASSSNVILTPHIAGWTMESKLKLAEILADKILKIYDNDQRKRY